MNKKIQLILALLLISIVAILWFQKNQAYKEMFQAKQETRKVRIAQDSLVKLSDGFYKKLVADTLTRKQLKKLANEVLDLKNSKPISVTKTIIKPIEVEKEIDKIEVRKDSVFILDFYPSKENYFLKYTNKFSVQTEKGLSNFVFDTISLKQVVSKKENGLYQIDFKGPDFLQLESIDIQTEPITIKKTDNWGTVLGVEYGKNLETNRSILEVNTYQRYKKFYFGGSLSSDKDLKLGVKIEL